MSCIWLSAYGCIDAIRRPVYGCLHGCIQVFYIYLHIVFLNSGHPHDIRRRAFKAEESLEVQKDARWQDLHRLES